MTAPQTPQPLPDIPHVMTPEAYKAFAAAYYTGMAAMAAQK